MGLRPPAPNTTRTRKGKKKIARGVRVADGEGGKVGFFLGGGGGRVAVQDFLFQMLMAL